MSESAITGTRHISHSSDCAVRALRLALYVLAVLAFVPAAWLATKPWKVHAEDGLIALHVPLGRTDLQGLRMQFVPSWSDYHDVLLAFPFRTGDPAVEKAITRAVVISAGARGAPFEFAWRVLRDGAVVAQGDGSDGAVGAIPDEGGSRKLLFGEFRARAGQAYELHASFGAGMLKFLDASPVLQVRMANTPRVNRLRYFRRLDGGSSLALGLMGLGFLVSALRLERKQRARLTT